METRQEACSTSMVPTAAASGLQRKLKEEAFAFLPSTHAKEVGLGRMGAPSCGMHGNVRISAGQEGGERIA